MIFSIPHYQFDTVYYSILAVSLVWVSLAFLSNSLRLR